MNQDVLKSIIVSHKERFLRSISLIPRKVLADERIKLLSKEVVFITGIRRSGKSSLMYLIQEMLREEGAIPTENILFVNFEDERFINFGFEHFDSLYKSFLEIENPVGRKYLFFDEIQNIAGWERWVNRLYEFEDVKIFITGSNASLLSTEVSASLTGRNRQIQLSTFTFVEFCSLYGVKLSDKKLYSDNVEVETRRILNNYFALGGFPEAAKNNDITIVDQYFKDIMYRDIIARYRVRNIKDIKALAIYLITNTGSINSYDNLRKVIGAKNVSTIKNYISIFQDVYLVHALPLFSYSVKKQIYNPNKYYVSDIGFYHAVGFKFSGNSGVILENLVFHEMEAHSENIFYWKSNKGFEVDFLTQHGIKIHSAIQVCYHLNFENMDRECRGLLAASKEVSAMSLLIITNEQNETITFEGVEIQVVSFIKWVAGLNEEPPPAPEQP
jgi:predicted AAA+ superfamily ATPase